MPPVARHVDQIMSNPRFSSYVTFYDVSSNVYQALSDGAYLCGTEQIEWSDALGTMQMFTVNESHSHLITGGAVQVDSIKTRVERAPGFSA
jgi:hypothetical protein